MVVEMGALMEFWLVALKVGFIVLCGAKQSSLCFAVVFSILLFINQLLVVQCVYDECKSGWTVFVNI